MHHYPENHKIQSAGFLRAAVLGANDGIISTSSLIVGVTASGLSEREILTTSIAALIAGAMSMAAGEYVSVSSQADTEKADIEREKWELENQPESELKELAEIYIQRGLYPELAKEVATELTKHDALGAHIRDEIGIVDEHKANPLQAAITSAATFTVGAFLPVSLIFFVATESLIKAQLIFTVFILMIMGAVAAKAGGASIIKGATRVAFWGAAAMAFTAFIGSLFETSLV